ncbi:MAG: FAD-binding oxidoreductase [Streptosporangiales bacterium]|nr:FAD-binding oxidoreductase [Streptosporangiales bacterium]
MDPERLKESFARVAAHGDEVPLFFYSHLFLTHPELRALFPVSMSAQRDRLLGALGEIVAQAADSDRLVPFLRGLGKDHRKFGTLAEHYPAVGQSLLATLAYFSGAGWTAQLEDDWTQAYTLIAKVMSEAAAESEADDQPAWWDAVVVGHERRTLDISVLRIAPRARLPFAPGQSVAVECAQRPRIWRYFSPANAPRDDGTIDLHVRMLEGGAVSSALARTAGVGTRLRLGPPVGTLRLDLASGRDLLLAAGSTGLAPLKAIVEHAGLLPDPPRTRLVFGTRTAADLYDLAALEKLAARWPWLTVVPVVSHDKRFAGEQGTVADSVARLLLAAPGETSRHDVYVCGSPAMVTATVGRLETLGVPREQTFYEDFGWS